MKKRLNENSGPLALVALVVALLGTGIVGANAAGVLVTTKQIKNGTITTKDLKNSGIKSVDVKNGTIDSADIEEGGVEPEDVTMPAPGQFQQSGAHGAAVGDGFAPVDVVGAYNKTDASSRLEVSWTGSAGAAFHPCVFQLRVDGASSGAGELFVANGSTLSVSATALFDALPAGPHQIEVWARSPGAVEGYECTVGPQEATIAQTFIVTEQVV